jgi:hypothetical protein
MFLNQKQLGKKPQISLRQICQSALSGHTLAEFIDPSFQILG